MLKKFGIGLAAIALIIAGFAMTTNATQNDNEVAPKETFLSYYRYLGSTQTLQDFQDRNNWVVSAGPGQEPGCNGMNLPCLVSSSISDIDDFVESIDETTDVTDHVEERKP